MSFIFADSFDFYTAPSDAAAGYWDSAGTYTLGAGRFSGSQCVTFGTSIATILTKASGSNDTTHHIVCAYMDSNTLSGANQRVGLTLFDGATAQCTISFRSDGAIELRSGSITGGVLATYAAAITQNVWTAFEFEVTINNTTGSFTVRKNGNTSNDFSATSLNTRVSANNYANKLSIVTNSVTGQQNLDDLFWFNTTGSAPTNWVGDIRSYQLMPATSVSQQFAPNLSPAVDTTTGSTSSAAAGANAARYSPIVANFTGTVASAQFTTTSAATANVKVTLYDASNGGQPGVPLATATVANPVNGVNTATFGSPPSVTKGETYYVATDQDASVTYQLSSTTIAGCYSGTAVYASFPGTNPGSLTSTVQALRPTTIFITPTNNAELVSETQEDGIATYVYDSTVGDADFYTIETLPITPTSIVAVTTRGFVAKSDAGTRFAQVQMQSGATTVQSTALALSTSFQWTSRTDVVDPNTSASWTASGVNAIKIGPTVQA